eukprot:TRINITY_DN80316_c0_g1_i1.p1 TRINITY_DN80316_c0_g1~~TRINITY_DN80316_c0_g1_i1.p1  ORF type:complete len:686 (+),score=118.82 TRINITY_DN80316_c0_g1_i1:139-2196(+)
MQHGGPELDDAIEVIPNRLYWKAVDTLPQDTARAHFFSVEDELEYQPFAYDFGPLSLGLVYEYCKRVDGLLALPRLSNRALVHCCSPDPRHKANAVLLISLYRVIVQRLPVSAAFAPFRVIANTLRPFRDASALPTSVFHLTVEDCLLGMEKAIELGWFDYKTFDAETYNTLDSIDTCGMNWIMPNKFLAFAGPSETPVEEGLPVFTPEHYLPIFRKLGIKLVVRLNSPQYDRAKFTQAGFQHLDLFFKDGSCPSSEIITKFLYMVEAEAGAVAVHCKAGLGRTCTLMGLYAMKHCQFPARAFIGWARMCRPGSVLGPQQQFLVDMQPEMFHEGTLMASPLAAREARSGARVLLKSPSMCDKERALAESYEDKGQGDRLCQARGQMMRPDLIRKSNSTGSIGGLQTPMSPNRRSMGGLSNAAIPDTPSDMNRSPLSPMARSPVAMLAHAHGIGSLLVGRRSPSKGMNSQPELRASEQRGGSSSASQVAAAMSIDAGSRPTGGEAAPMTPTGSFGNASLPRGLQQTPGAVIGDRTPERADSAAGGQRLPDGRRAHMSNAATSAANIAATPGKTMIGSTPPSFVTPLAIKQGRFLAAAAGNKGGELSPFLQRFPQGGMQTRLPDLGSKSGQGLNPYDHRHCFAARGAAGLRRSRSTSGLSASPTSCGGAGAGGDYRRNVWRRAVHAE